MSATIGASGASAEPTPSPARDVASRDGGRVRLRPIEARDDAAVAALIRTVMPELGAQGPGFAINDPEVDAMSATYRGRAAYWVVERDGRILGAGGFAPLEGGDAAVCELRKMYFQRELRGLGVGAALLDHLLAEARRYGFTRCYLETLSSMSDARRLYERRGFTRLQAPMGETGHFGCNTFYAREL